MYWYGSGWSSSPYQYQSSMTGGSAPRLHKDGTNQFQRAQMEFVWAPSDTMFYGSPVNGNALLYGNIQYLLVEK